MRESPWRLRLSNFTIKNDDLDDPFINDEHVKFLQIGDDQQIAYLRKKPVVSMNF